MIQTETAHATSWKLKDVLFQLHATTNPTLPTSFLVSTQTLDTIVTERASVTLMRMGFVMPMKSLDVKTVQHATTMKLLRMQEIVTSLAVSVVLMMLLATSMQTRLRKTVLVTTALVHLMLQVDRMASTLPLKPMLREVYLVQPHTVCL